MYKNNKMQYIHTPISHNYGTIYYNNVNINYGIEPSGLLVIDRINGVFFDSAIENLKFNNIEQLINYYIQVSNISIQYDNPIEVSKPAFNKIMNALSGYATGLEKNGKYYIKVWWMKYVFMIKQIVNDNQLTNQNK